MCGISYPTLHMKCLVCSEDTDYFNNVDPDEDWVEAVAFKRKWLDDEERPLIPKVNVQVYLREDQLWLDAWDLWHDPARLYRLQAGDLVQVGQQIFEVQGYIAKTHCYLVTSFDTSAEGIEEQLQRWIEEAAQRAEDGD